MDEFVNENIELDTNNSIHIFVLNNYVSKNHSGTLYNFTNNNYQIGNRNRDRDIKYEKNRYNLYFVFTPSGIELDDKVVVYLGLILNTKYDVNKDNIIIHSDDNYEMDQHGKRNVYLFGKI